MEDQIRPLPMAPALEWKSPKIKPYPHMMGSGMVIGNLGRSKKYFEDNGKLD